MNVARALLQHPRSARLLRPGDFTALRHSGKRLATKHFQCEFRPNETRSARLGMAVSRRVSKRAVERNRIRRQIRETFRLQRPNLPPCDILIIARTAAATADSRTLRLELVELWRKFAAQAAAGSSAATPSPLNAAGTTGTMRGSADS
jgi:ribonuclease P protein component